MNKICTLNGYDIIITTMKTQIRTHRKKRISKKWAKRYGYMYFDIQNEGDAYVVDQKIYMTLHDYEKLRDELKSIPKPDCKCLNKKSRRERNDLQNRHGKEADHSEITEAG